jgi:hypothetical protein
MRLGPLLVRTAWYGYWNAMRYYHRFEVRGLERVERFGPALIVGYHGRAVAHDMIMLMAVLRERGGRDIRAVIHKMVPKIPILRWIPEGLGYITGDGDDMERLIERGESLMVTPAGSLEGCRSFRERYKVKWGNRYGYLRLALKYKLPIIPTAGTGVDDTYIGLNDGYAWGKRLKLPGNLPFWIAFGINGPWPWTLPFPVKIVCHVGEPIDLEADGPVDPDDREALARLHAKVTGAVQALLDEARGIRPKASSSKR